jgi:hypothetical protein
MENTLSLDKYSQFGSKLMNLEKQAASTTGRYASAMGKGMIAGLAGTAAITLSQTIEMKLTGREKSSAPADVANKTLGTHEINPEKKEDFSNTVHWGYGSAWGAIRGILKEAGLPSWAATATHFAGVYGTALVMLPKSKVAPPLKEWGAKAIAMDALHHGIYAVVTGLVYDAIDNDNKADEAYRRMVDFYDHELDVDEEPEIEVLQIETEYYETGY